MGTIRVRFILVALVVSFFAVGMAAFLNYFKYKSTIGGIVKSRVLVIGRGIAVTAPLALVGVIRRFERDMSTLEVAAGHLEDKAVSMPSGNSAFDAAIGTLRASLVDANKSLDDLRAKLDAAG